MDTSASVDPNAFVVPMGKAFMAEQIFMARGDEVVTRSNGADLSAYGALDTCCTSTLIWEETLSGLVASGLEFLPTNDIKLFRGIGKELVASKQAGHLRCRIIGI